MPTRVVKMSCSVCGGRDDVHVVTGSHGGHEHVCADCEYRRQHPSAEARVLAPRERRPLPKQKERLF